MVSKKIGGIYIIFIGEYFYIGSSKNFKKRSKEHFNMLKNCKHHNMKMQNVYNKYLSYDFQIMEILEESKLIEAEQTYIDMYFDFDLCLNLSKSADCPLRNLPKSEAHCKALSTANKGRKPSEECIAAIKLYRTGSKSSDETKKKISFHNIGEKNYFYGKSGEKHPLYGKKNSLETKYKKSASKLGELNPNFGKVFSMPILVEYHNKPNDLFKTTKEASLYFGVSDRTILRWLKNNPPKEQKSIFNNLNIKNMRNL